MFIRREILITVLVIIMTWNQSQGQTVDSLRTLVRNSKSIDTTYVLALAELAYQFYSTKPDSSLLLATKADSLSGKLHFDKAQGRARRVIGIYYWAKGDYYKSLDYFNEALELSQRANDLKGIAGCYTSIGVIYRNQGNYAKALEYYFNALRIRQKINDRQGISTTYNNLGLVYHVQKDYLKALENFNRSAAIQKEMGDQAGLGRSYLNMGLSYQNANELDSAHKYYNKSLEIVERINDSRGITFAMDNLALLFLKVGDTKKAGQYLERGLNIALEKKMIDRQADLMESYAQYYNEINQPLKALEMADKSQKLARKVVIMEVLENALKQKYIAAQKLGRYRDALDFFSRYVEVHDSIARKEIDKTALAKEYELKEEKLRNENAEKELDHLREQERQKRVINTFAGISGTFILVSVLVYFSNRKIRKQKEELQKQRRILAEQNEELTQSQEEILAQRDLVTAQNRELDEAKMIIENQNQEISLRNKSLELEVEKRTQALVEYNQQLEQFAFMSAHNLRAPVARILGLGYVLELSSKDPSEVKLIAEKITNSTRELDQVVRDINMILQSQRDNISVVTEVNVVETFVKIQDMLKDECKETGATISLSVEATPFITTVHSYFESIFLNLISNAIKYRDPQRPLRIQIKSEVTDEYYVFHVADNGLGLDMDLYGDKIFKLYNRFHSHVEGKGIGLYLVKTQLAILRGKIEVESKVKEGATFKVYFKR